VKDFFHIPFTEIKPSLSSHVNFFYQHQNVFIMDNHRLALWSMAQKLKNSPANILHIDAHYDCAYGDVEDYRELKLDLFNMSLDEFLKQRTQDKVFPLFRWDNYFKFLFDYHSEYLLKKVFITHKIGNTYPNLIEGDVVHFFKTLNDVEFQNTKPWIVNLDMDFFFTMGENKKLLVSEDFLESFLAIIEEKLKNNEISCLILALSPECSGGFLNAYHLAHKITKRLNIPFSLPL
jgi:hypothetical protein